jgi:hypothetical protein
MTSSRCSSIASPSARHCPNVPCSIRSRASRTWLSTAQSASAPLNCSSFCSFLRLSSPASRAGASPGARALAPACLLRASNSRVFAKSRSLYRSIFIAMSVLPLMPIHTRSTCATPLPPVGRADVLVRSFQFTRRFAVSLLVILAPLLYSPCLPERSPANSDSQDSPSSVIRLKRPSCLFAAGKFPQFLTEALRRD